MNSIKIFENEQFGKIRIATNENNEPLFCLTDVCQILGLRVDGVLPRLKKDGYNQIGVADSLGRNQKTYFVNEMNLYKVIMRSDKPQAESFQDWVCGEVLPSIRKHGAFMSKETLEKVLTSPDLLIELATTLKEEQRKREEEQNKRIEAELKIKNDAPKVLFSEAVIGSRSSCLIGELAKIITQNGVDIGQKRLFKWMRDNHYLGRTGENYNIPNQQYIEQGLFELKKGIRSGLNGVMHTVTTPKVTGKGQVYFVNKFLSAKK